MTMLEQLKLADATPKKDRSPTARLCRKLLDALDLQIDLAEADGAETEVKRTRQRWVSNDAGGKDLRELPVRLRRWWWKDDTGRVYLSLRRGARSLELAPDKTAIEVGTVADLPAQLAILREAVLAAELDGCIDAAPGARSAPKRAKASEPADPVAGPKTAGQRGTKKGNG